MELKEFLTQRERLQLKDTIKPMVFFEFVCVWFSCLILAIYILNPAIVNPKFMYNNNWSYFTKFCCNVTIFWVGHCAYFAAHAHHFQIVYSLLYNYSQMKILIWFLRNQMGGFLKSGRFQNRAREIFVTVIEQHRKIKMYGYLLA